MESHSHLFLDLTYIFLAAVAGGLLAWRLGLPLILGFVVGGIVISPFTPGIQLSDIHTFEQLAEVGVVLLMFSIGVEFSIADLLSVKWVALVGGTIGITLSLSLAMGVARLMGWGLAQGVVIGATVSVASTMVLARILTDRNAMGTTYGRVMIGITLFEDLAVVFMTAALPAFSGSAEGRLAKAAWTIGKAIVLLIPLGFLAMKGFGNGKDSDALRHCSRDFSRADPCNFGRLNRRGHCKRKQLANYRCRGSGRASV